MKRSLPTLALAAALALAGTASAQPAPSAEAAPAREGQRADDRRPEQPTTVDLLGQPVQLTGSWEYSDERRRNFDLDRGDARNRRVREHEIKLEARTRPTAASELFVQAVGLHETRRTQGGTRTVTRSLERGQAWLKLERLGGTPWSMQVGRVALVDRRAWWWDDDLDALRLQYAGETWRLDTGLAKELARVASADRGIRPEARGVVRWFGQAGWRPARRHALEAFWLLARDGSGAPAAGRAYRDEDATDPADFKGRWLGLRASGEFRDELFGTDGARLAYWADLARVSGREAVTGFSEGEDGRFTAGTTTTRRVRGRALDLGATLVVPVALRPSLTVAYARGSGGTRSATRDDNFRQTGLQENKARFGGVKRLRVYGELLRPELANLAVTTLAGGIRVLDNSSVELVAHRYRQAVAATTLAGARLAADPAGLHRDIGREIDLVLALREWRQLELTLAWSRFTPGAAFAEDQRDPAHALELGLAFNF